MTGRTCIVLTGILSLLLLGCEGKRTGENNAKRPRPVTVIKLKERHPVRNTLLAGSVSSWKTEKMGFQVPGRVKTVLEPGVDILGRTFDETGDEISSGTVIATLEKDRFQLQLASAQAQEETALAKADAKNTEIQNVLPAQVKSATVALTLAENNYRRVKQLYEKKAVAQSQYDQSLAELDSAQAELEKSKANIKVAKAELISLRAQVKEAAEAINQAEIDLKDAELISPFNGQIESVHEIAGGYAQAGEEVVTIQMMDPIQVEVSVSEQTDARVNYNDLVHVFLPESDKPTEAMVYEKASVADPATRTFRVTLLVRNRRIEVGVPDDIDQKKHLRVRLLTNLSTEQAEREPPFYVNVGALHEDGSGFYVWKILNPPQDRGQVNGSKYQLKKVRVVPGDKRIPYLQVVTLRELKDYGELDPEKDIIAGPLHFSDGRQLSDDEINRFVKDEDAVYHVRERWRLRPGDIVRVNLGGEVSRPGFYVPMNAIFENVGKKYVFLATTSGDNTVVKQQEIKVTDHVGTEFRIEAVGKTPLTADMNIVAAGALFLRDGEQVRVTKVIEVPQ